MAGEIESVGKIHGIISREGAREMWAPYGERLKVDASLDPNCLTPLEAVAIAWGSDEEDCRTIYEYVEPLVKDDDMWIYTVGEVIEKGVSTELPLLLVRSAERQQEAIEQHRRKVLDRMPDYIGRLSRAIFDMAEDAEVFLTHQQAELATDRLIAPDGSPYMQLTPITPYELVRYMREQDGKEPEQINVAAFTDFTTGMLVSVHASGGSWNDTAKHNRPHEFWHSIQGVELYDITRDDGRRVPVGTTVGHFAEPLTAATDSITDYSRTADMPLAEGFTDYLSRQSIRVSATLGAICDNDYTPYVSFIERMWRERPDCMHVINEAAWEDATPARPETRREALEYMHIEIDELLAARNALRRIEGSERHRAE